MTHRRKQKELQSTTTQDYWRELEELQQLSSTVLNDLQKLRLEPSITSSPRNMRKIDKIMSKAEKQIETLRKWHARLHARHRSKHTPAPWPDTGKTEKVNPVHYQQMQQFTNDVLDAIDRGQELHLPIQRKPSKHQHESWCQRSHSHVIPTIEHWQDQLTILKRNPYWRAELSVIFRATKKSGLVNSTPNNFNRDKGVEIPTEWKRLFKGTSY